LEIPLALQDAAKRAAKVRATGTQTVDAQGLKDKASWQNLLTAGQGGAQLATSLPNTVYVPQMLSTEWGQGEWGPPYVYNNDIPDGYVTGCTATAMAQAVNYFAFPPHVAGGTYNISIDGNWATWTPYTLDPTFTFDYSLMPVPGLGSGSSQDNIDQVAELMLDCGVSIDTLYSNSNGSGAYPSDIPNALLNTFYYNNADYFWCDGTTDWDPVMQSSLESGSPCVSDINGHCIVMDGYETDSNDNDLFHVNMGWYGEGDEWSTLPLPGWGLNGFVYDIQPGAGPWVISGYVKDPLGNGIANVVMNGLPIYPGASGPPATDSTGYYYGLVTNGWSGTVTPTLTGYEFSPTLTNYNSVTADQTPVNYTSVPDVVNVTSVSGSPNPVPSSGQVQCNVNANDSWSLALTYIWTAVDGASHPVGTFNDNTSATPTWTAPANNTGSQVAYTIAVTVTDTNSVQGSASYTQAVKPAAEALTVTGGPSGTPNPVASGGQTQCSVTVVDNWGRTPTYQWTAVDSGGKSAGSFDSSTSDSPKWTAPVVISDTAVPFTITVVASSGTAQVQSSYTQNVNPPADKLTITAGPSASPNPVPASGTTVLSVTAAETHGLGLTYTWAVRDSQGHAAGSLSSATAANPQWTAPANLTWGPVIYTLSVTVKSTSGKSAYATGKVQVQPVEEVKITAGPSGTPAPVASNGAVTCSVTILDSLNLAPGYKWKATDSAGHSAGTFDNVTAASPHWTAPAVRQDTSASYVISVTACCTSSGRAASGSFTQVVNPVPDVMTVTAGPGGTPNPVASYGLVSCWAMASDSRNHTFTYQWSAAAGSFTNPTSRTPIWTAPANASDSVRYYALSVTVTSSLGSSTTATYQQGVNPVPEVLSITAGPTGSPNPVVSEGVVQCSVTAKDSRNAALTYKWMATDSATRLAGSFDNATKPNPQWTAPSNTSGVIQNYTLLCVVRSSSGLTVSKYFVEQVKSGEWIADLPAGMNTPAGGPVLSYLLFAPGQLPGQAYNAAARLW
jgi:hypothetical protein